jgi:hypothetical protein
MNMRHELTVFIERGVDIMKIQLYARHEEAYVADANVTRTNPFGARKTEKHAWTCMDLHGPAWTCMDLHGPAWTNNSVFKNTQLVRLPPITEII